MSPIALTKSILCEYKITYYKSIIQYLLKMVHSCLQKVQL